MNALLIYCRAGFEKEVAAEISDKAAQAGGFGYAKVVSDSGWVLFSVHPPVKASFLAKAIDFKQLIFARQLIVVCDELTQLPLSDRITPIISSLQTQFTDELLRRSDTLWLETPDTNESKSLATFCRKLTVPLRSAMKKCGWLQYRGVVGVSVHLLFLANNHCFLGYSYNDNHSPHFMGIARLRFPHDAPSRSTLKLDEAITTFLPGQLAQKRLREGMQAVDLGACPGGWTYQLVKRGLFVYGVDHGKIAPSLMATSKVEHCAEDGFVFKPPRHANIDWLVCDMVEQPQRISALICKWLTQGWARQSIFNLKLPMKKRYQEVMRCFELIDQNLTQAGLTYELQAKQLYHDREEITVYINIKG
ncbi:23S rRNA (cytidine(2498)-2'-O)-methyltransferase RlmM [Pasteurellaceae bacterium HPA106]|uniref:23S rRNA (cytidine(2498)-2'-O)-methyltransferase RlmM n=1 Tax=Spirabiliibacterium pneumoniae TaxID=221400 RepID=UPI001AACD479|nr:23S rRNA (cytidine(2498)-2'-O)-methyltransferase RlmM [Spirabiliibacterium pneumoniae]MBE2896506.1 23S rRNA (cytidine(2498)-2'-O)-methyltransferase RlmM [Spirabiliibacterium pneumoniae]